MHYLYVILRFFLVCFKKKAVPLQLKLSLTDVKQVKICDGTHIECSARVAPTTRNKHKHRIEIIIDSVCYLFDTL